MVDCYGVGSSEVIVGFDDDVAVVSSSSTFARVLIPFVRMHSCTFSLTISKGVLFVSFFAIVTNNGDTPRSNDHVVLSV